MEQVAPIEASDGVAIQFGFRHMLRHLGPVAAVRHLASLPMTTHRPSTRVKAFCRVETGGRAIGESKRFFERWRTLPDRSIATLIACAERSGAAFATV